MSIISGNMIGSYSQIGKTFIITDENGAELTGVVTDKEVVFTANAATDIREGKVAATDAGIVTGEKVIPSYHTKEGSRLITSGSSFYIPLSSLDCYDYTFLQCIICVWNTNISDSVAAEKIVLFDSVYPVQSTTAVASVTKNHDTKRIVLGITNDTQNTYVLRYITYKEIN